MRRLSVLQAVLPLVGVLAGCQSSPTESDGVSTLSGPVAVAPESATIQSGQGLRFTATVSATDGPGWTPADISWQSTDPSIATVAPDGTVQGVTPGQVEIVANWQGTTGVARLTVLESTSKGGQCATARLAATAEIPRQPSSCK